MQDGEEAGESNWKSTLYLQGREINLRLPSAGTDQIANGRLPSPPACLPQPISLNARDYFKASLPTLLLVCLCLAQAFGYRLRRVIAAFYFPKVNRQTALPLSMQSHNSPLPYSVLPCSNHYRWLLLLPTQPLSERRSGLCSSTMSS